MDVITRHPDPWPDIVETIKEHAVAQYPNEACGIVVDGKYIACENIHPEPTKAFRINPEVTGPYYAAGTLQAIVHSHPDGPNHPSLADLQGQLDSDIIWGIVPVIGDAETQKALYPCDTLWWGDQLPPIQLERRKFIWGIFHCWQLYRDWWRQERGILMPTWACDSDFVELGFDPVATCFHENGGHTELGKIDIGDLQVGDMLLGKVRGSFPNHCAVFVGNDELLHHPPSGLSGKAELLRWWPYVATVYRYDAASDTTSLR